MQKTIEEISTGNVVDYRGAAATVTHVWTNWTGAPCGIPNQAGMVIEWEEGGETKRCRLVWPEFSAPELAELSLMTPEDRAAAEQARYEADLVNRPITVIA